MGIYFSVIELCVRVCACYT